MSEDSLELLLFAFDVHCVRFEVIFLLLFKHVVKFEIKVVNHIVEFLLRLHDVRSFPRLIFRPLIFFFINYSAIAYIYKGLAFKEIEGVLE